MTANRARAILNCTTSRVFCVWRLILTVFFIVWTIPLYATKTLDWDIQVVYYNLYLGILPSAMFLMLRYIDSRWAGWFAYAYDVFIFLALVVALVLLPNYMVFGFVLPLIGFIFEGIFLTAVIIRHKRCQ